MKKKIFILTLLVVLCVACLPAFAMDSSESRSASPAKWNYAADVITGINFSGTTATCSVVVSGYSSVTAIDATVTFECVTDNNLVATWPGLHSNTKNLYFSNTAPVTKGKTYRLTVYARLWSGSQYEDIIVPFQKKY